MKICRKTSTFNLLCAVTFDPPGQTCAFFLVPVTGPHLHVVHAHEIPTVIQVLFEVTVLEDKIVGRQL